MSNHLHAEHGIASLLQHSRSQVEDPTFVANLSPRGRTKSHELQFVQSLALSDNVLIREERVPFTIQPGKVWSNGLLQAKLSVAFAGKKRQQHAKFSIKGLEQRKLKQPDRSYETNT